MCEGYYKPHPGARKQKISSTKFFFQLHADRPDFGLLWAGSSTHDANAANLLLAPTAVSEKLLPLFWVIARPPRGRGNLIPNNTQTARDTEKLCLSIGDSISATVRPLPTAL